MAEALAYAGRDIDSMSLARNYHRWILDLFAPYLGRRVAEEERPDSVVYVNVLEHVREDEAEPRLAAGALAEGGRVFLSVPAFRWLYGSFDRQVGHQRRYTRAEPASKCGRAGFRAFVRRVEAVVPPPLGRNVLLVAEKGPGGKGRG